MEAVADRLSFGDIEILLSALPEDGKQRDNERRCVKELLDLLFGEEVELSHFDDGKPYIKGKTIEISISHTKGYAAVARNPNGPIGIDIEYRSDRVLRIKSKFLSDRETALQQACNLDESDFCLLAWCVKEAAFKKCGLHEIDFKQHFVLSAINPDKVVLDVCKGNFSTQLTFDYLITPEWTLVAG